MQNTAYRYSNQRFRRRQGCKWHIIASWRGYFVTPSPIHFYQQLHFMHMGKHLISFILGFDLLVYTPIKVSPQKIARPPAHILKIT